jgi:glycosyltransferase involved in cell wall biosynthesis
MMFVFPYPDWSVLLSLNPLFSLLHQVPLIVISSILMMIFRPAVVMGNGVVSSIPGLLLKPAIGCRTVISHRGDITYYTSTRLRHLLWLLIQRRADLALVNSEGSRRDFSLVCPQSRIVVVEHSADRLFFSKMSKDHAKRLLGFENRFVIGYVGNLDKEKFCHWVLQLSRRLRAYEDILVAFIGQGELSGEIKKSSLNCDAVRYLGYVQDRRTLHAFYSACDIVCAPIEETYLSRPAVEALASGTPVLAPDMPAVYKKQLANVRIKSRMLPESVGWVVSAGDLESMVRVVLDARKNAPALRAMGENCRAFAMERYGPDNIDIAVKELHKLQTQSCGECRD